MLRAPRSQAPRTKTDLMGSDSDEGGAPPQHMYESALQALLSVDIRVDTRGVAGAAPEQLAVAGLEDAQLERLVREDGDLRQRDAHARVVDPRRPRRSHCQQGASTAPRCHCPSTGDPQPHGCRMRNRRRP